MIVFFIHAMYIGFVVLFMSFVAGPGKAGYFQISLSKSGGC